MKKKSIKRTSHKRPSKRLRNNDRYIQFFGIVFGMMLGILAVAAFDSTDKPYVLGTSVFIARGDSVSGNEGPLPENEGPFKKLPEQKTLEERKSEKQGNTSPGTLVDCVNPAGKHVQVSLRACEEMNKKKAKFTFTELKAENKGEGDLRKGSESGKPQKQRGKGPGSPEEKQLQSAGAEVEITRGRNALEVRKKGTDETEKGDKPDTLETLNKELNDLDVELEPAEGNDVILRKNHVQAQTPFPLSVDPTTKKFSVMMSSGKKELSVMPDEAVERLLQTKMLTTVENQVSSSAGGVADASAHTTLTELNNKPVFKVQGFSHKKVFGLFPASFAKTVYVSAEDGTVVKTDETFFTKALEALSL